jgi:hypothetical protein
MSPVVLSGPGMRVRLETIPGFTARRLRRVLPFHFQAPPLDQFEWGGGFNWQDYDTVTAGQFSQPQSRMLRTFSFQTIFTDVKYPWTLRKEQGYTPNPMTLTRRLMQIAEAGTPIRFTCGQPVLWEINDLDLAVTLREVRPVEKSGEIDARYVTLTFVEFRHPRLPRFGSAAPPGKKLPATLLVRTLPMGRRTLYALAKFYYGSQSLWRRIAKANGMTNLSPTVDLRHRYRKQRNKKITIPVKPAPVRGRGR